ncbi:shikimate dehydrogenase [Paramagnetospirillum marisnigri]|uniref:Shikimate dehydrogenase (NADP(+)) n=1 Tax=Paramagnetospirillum marisnigri TaxID=1285242 RepID=A0A178MNY4_9PROT|nr:shikimate dehydrogenase [Paramagnetospirillum marisnigri]OAN50339.1 shikimate dehydrogenase [Paramagnetospirillum marisnigri]
MISGKAKLAGVMGWPVSHSRSPRLHGFWLQSLGIDGAYVPLAVAPDDLATALHALPRLGFRGCNLTVPHKEAALGLVHEVEPLARRIGAINTIMVEDDGRLIGRNTDAFGFLENLRRGAPGWAPPAGPAVVIGAGGAARAVVAALSDAGVPEIHLANRGRDRAEKLAADLGGPVTVVDWNRRGLALDGAALLVNTTTLGMTGQPALDLDLSAMPVTAVVNDIVYAPLETELLARAKARGNPVVDGLGMLLWQAVPGFEAWFGTRPQVNDALRDFVLA